MKKLDLKKCFYEEPRKNLFVLGVEFLLIGVCLALDLLTKEYVYGAIDASGKSVTIIKGFISLTAVKNTGASFGIFSDATAVLMAVSLVTSIVLTVIWIFTLKERNGWLRAAFIMMIAGAIGNVVDRIAFGYVRDFINCEIYVCNVADVELCVGCALMVVYIVFFYRPEKKPAKAAESGADTESEGEAVIVPEAADCNVNHDSSKSERGTEARIDAVDGGSEVE